MQRFRIAELRLAERASSARGRGVYRVLRYRVLDRAAETLRQRTRDLAKRNPAVTGLAMRLKRERQTNHSDAFFKTSAFLSSLIESTRPPSAEYAEMYAATVRSWLRSEWWAPQRRRLA